MKKNNQTQRPSRWGRNCDQCIKCNKSNKPYKGLGMCTNCYFKIYRQNNPEIIKKARDNWVEKNKEYVKKYQKKYQAEYKKRISGMI